MAKTALDESLEAITREFVHRIVTAIRNASFADVAGYGPPDARGSGTVRSAGRGTRVIAHPKRAPGAGGGPRRERQSSETRTELRERVLATLKSASTPLGVRALANELGVSVDALAAPVRELRTEGLITKRGEKRATTYSVT